MPYISQVNPTYQFDQTKCVVSLFNTGSALTGHGMLVVEREKNEKPLVAQCEVVGKIIVDETRGERYQGKIGNAQGYITKIRVIEGENYTSPKKYSTIPSKSWYATPEAVEKMIQSIIFDRDRTKAAMDKGEEPPIKYQVAGSYRAWILGGNEGENCLTWAENKLRVAGIEPKTTWLDWIKAVPELHINSRNYLVKLLFSK